MVYCFSFQIDMAWSSNIFCDFGMALNPPAQGQQTSSRNKGPAPKFNHNSGNNNHNTVLKLETLMAGTAAVSFAWLKDFFFSFTFLFFFPFFSLF